MRPRAILISLAGVVLLLTGCENPVDGGGNGGSDTVSVTGVTLTETSLAIVVGDTADLTETVAPENASDKTVSWSSSDSAVATVDTDGVVTGVAEGSATITVTTNDGGHTAEATVTVTESVTGVSLDQSEVDFQLTGKTAALTATVSPANAPDTSVTWSSSDESVATVASDGTVTSVGSGTATITVTTNDGGLTAEATVSVPYPIVDAMAYTSVAWFPDGTIWTWGDGGSGELGNGTTDSVSVPTQIASGQTWLSVNAGQYHAFAIREDGTLWGWGYNYEGQLGTGTKLDDRDAPVQIGSDSNWVMVEGAGSASGNGEAGHSLGLKNDGTLWAWGNNDNGELGDGTTTESLTPKQIGTDTDWVGIASSVYTSFAIKEDGTLYSWGADTDGSISYQGLLGDGGSLQGPDVLTPTQVGSDSDWVSISAQEAHALAIKEDGTLWGWGQNGDYELGQGSGSTTDQSAPIQIGTDSDWVAVEASLYRSMAIKSDGTRWVWGEFDADVFALGYDNDPDGDGMYDDVYEPTQAGSETDWVTVAIGYEHGLGVRAQERVFGWGANGSGQVGNNTTIKQESPTELTFN